MSTTLLNGETGWEVTLDSGVQKFIRAYGKTAEDVILLDAAETAAAALSGSQTINVGGAITGGSATGLANDTTVYTMTVKVDGVDNAVAITGSTAQTYTNLLTQIDADLSGATSAIVGGNVVITSSSTGNASKIVITDTDLLATLTDFVGLLAPVDGDFLTDIKTRIHTPSGRTVFAVFEQAIETYDPNSDVVLLASQLADIAGAPAEADHNLVRAHLNALKNSVNDLHR